ncbi:MAG: CopD family protein [Bacteroidetes bacterium]|nr:CopD family protein [Rhodothermia bacterium]MCS7154343.1 CopD family protein [Bacteroidota bacterium]MCX7906620.1 CopD family protein [Bacteroidota bacterium]MDW8137099.1 hypothetical protein [Bacteroidota bacterium]MDW8285030.1 hypothetical protein [Bacteroidota bacterium]
MDAYTLSTLFRVLHVLGFSLWLGALLVEYWVGGAYARLEASARAVYAGIHRNIDRTIIHLGVGLSVLAGLGMLFSIGLGTVFGTRGGWFHLKILLGFVAAALQMWANLSFKRALEALTSGQEGAWGRAYRRWRLLAGLVLLMLLYNLLTGVISTA